MTRWTAILLVFSALVARTGDLPNRLTAEGIAEFTAAYREWDANRFSAAAGLFRRATTNAAPASTDFYWLGTAEFHRLLQLQTQPASASNERVAASAIPWRWSCDTT